MLTEFFTKLLFTSSETALESFPLQARMGKAVAVIAVDPAINFFFFV